MNRMTASSILLAAFLVGIVSVAQETIAVVLAQSNAAEFQSLFDGKSLNGWTQITGNPKLWAVEDGSLVMLGEGGGWLGTGRDHADFEFDFEFKLTPESNSGIYLRAPADKSHISRTGMEIQLLDETHPRYRDIKDWQKTGALYHVSPPAPGHLKPTGEWNRMEIRLEGPHLIVKLNGAKVVDDRLDSHPELDAEHPGLKRTTGRVGLQSHNGRVEFRKIRIRDLHPVRQ
ncbi:MAG: hypothetical protein ABS79_06725 [Planctomycetes bacterium SCN 63-9]|nr:MAG: hypothetical protein ABS79_06725 [Planctomycetes bacterium SCN 63-9]